MMLAYSNNKEESILGTVEQVYFHNPNDGFCVFRVNDEHYGEPVTVTANLPSLAAGENVSCFGRWVEHNKYGNQFKASALIKNSPKDIEAIKKFLLSGVIAGIGECYANKLLTAFGVNTLDVLANFGAKDEDTKFLTAVQKVLGVSGKTWDNICQGILEYRDNRKYEQEQIWLTDLGVGPMAIKRILNRYGKDTMPTIQKNPYILADEVSGFGFLTSDEIALKLNIPLDSPFRIRAALLYLVKESSFEGSCYIPIGKLLNRASTLLGIKTDDCSKPLQTLVDDDALRQLTIGERTVIGLRKFDVYEQAIAAKIKLLLSNSETCAESAGESIQKFEAQMKITLNEQQVEAVTRAIAENCLIITGGAGVGKTQVTKCINMALSNIKGYRLVSGCAPTGRAAKRLSEVLNEGVSQSITCCSIHRLLEPKMSSEGGFYFSRTSEKPLELDALIVDELSMVDTQLFYYLLDALPSCAKLILIGDSNQLSSVGAGKVLSDLIESGVIPVVRLTEVQRQAAGSQIILNAHRINKMQMPIIEDNEPSDFVFIEENDPEAIRDKVVNLVVNVIPEKYKKDDGMPYNPVLDIQVLSPMKKTVTGVYELNNALQKVLNLGGMESGNKVHRGEHVFCEKDKVIQTVNNYDKGVFNGDHGFIQSINVQEKLVQVLFSGTLAEEKLCYVDYTFEELGQLSLAYTTTVHKAQGNEFPIVIIPISIQHNRMLQKNLLYTAVTRGQKLVFIVGQKRALVRAIVNNKPDKRLTNLRARLTTQD